MPEHILSLSYGKDSIAAIHVAVDILGWPLDRIIHAEIMFDDKTPADLPPMMEFKAYADEKIRERWGIKVEHVTSKHTFRSYFFKPVKSSSSGGTDFIGKPHGWPYCVIGSWCARELKINPMKNAEKNGIIYLGIAFDEKKRFGQLSEKKKSPLVEAKWTENMCAKWCEENKLLSPIYKKSFRGGCWFCPKQSTNQLRKLRKEHPEYWEKLVQIDYLSPIPFHPDGKTVCDYDKRFEAEEIGAVPSDRRFRWAMIEGDDMQQHIDWEDLK